MMDLMPYLLVSLFMGAAVYAAGLLQFSHQWSILLLQITIGIGVYVLLCRVFCLKAFMEIWLAGWVKVRALGFRESGI
jgi:low affinity Fe/Cu permease